MEEERFVINNEEINQNTIDVKENNQNTIDIEENISDVPYKETIQIIEVDEPEIYNIDSDEAFSSLGEQNEQLNHSLMHGRDLPNQHPISAITGLRQELDNIESLKTVESDKKGYANYYMWDTSKELPPDNRVGYFVSIHTKDHKISICGDTTYNDGSYNPIKNRDEIFGVTVDSAGFVGWQHYDEEDKPRNEKEYVLVANTGIVKVRCFPSVVAGNYVMSSSDGRAKRTDNSHGYYVISIDEIDGNRCAVISLDSTMNQLYGLSKEVDSFNQRVDNVEINTVAAINAANAALKKELITGINSAVEGSQAALNRTEELGDTVDNLEETVVGMKVQIDAVSDGIVIAAQEEAQKAVAELVEDAVSTSQEISDLRNRVTEAENDIKEAHDTAVGLYNEINPLIEFNDEGGIGVSGVVATVKDNTSQLGLMSTYLSNDYETIDTWNKFGKDMSKIYYVEDEREYYYYDEHGSPPDWYHSSNPTDAGLSEVIASLRQDLNKDSSQIEGLTSYIGKSYETVSTWDWYDTVDVFDSGSADSFIIYKDSSGQYWHCDINAPDGVNPWSTFIPTTTFTEKDINKVYYAEDNRLYYYYDNGWHTTESSAAKLVESMAMTRQKADKNGASIETIVSYIGGEGSTIAGVKKFVDDTKAEINSLTSYIENDYIELDEEWNEEGKLLNKIYVTVDNGIKTYHYYRSYGPAPGWYNSTNPADAGLKTSIVDVQQQVTDNGARINELLSSQTETNNAVAQLQMKVDDTGASIESLVMNISKYSVGKYSQAYGLTMEEATELLRDGAVFVPSESVKESYSRVVQVDTEENIPESPNIALVYDILNSNYYYYYDKKLGAMTKTSKSDSSVETVYSISFIRDRYYTWDNKNGIWIESARGGVSFGTGYTNGNDTLRYFVVEDGLNQKATTIATKTSTIDSNGKPLTDTVYYITKDAGYFLRHTNGDVVEWYEVGALYHWELKNEKDENSGYWKRVATLESNTLNRAISQMRQTDYEIESSVANVKGDLSTVKQAVDGFSSTYVSQTNFDENMTQIQQKSSDSEATLSMLVSKGVKYVNPWNSDGKDKDTVWYNGTNYYYYANGQWNSTNSVTDSHIASNIRSAGIITAINNDKSEIKISADKVNITAPEVDLSGYVTIASLKSDGTTEIDGSRIKTGIIKSKNWLGNSVTNVSVSSEGSYGFDLQPDGYYESNNKSVANSVAICKVSFDVTETSNVVFIAKNSAELVHDYGIFGKIDTVLDSTNVANDEDCHDHFQNEVIERNVIYENVKKGSHYIYVLFKKDKDTDGHDDCLRFKLPDIVGTQINLNDGSITTPNFKVDSSGNLTLNGVITANDLATSKKTTINGDNITTGAIESKGFRLGNDGFSSVGTKFDLSNGSIVGKNIKIDSISGKVDIRGSFTTNWGANQSKSITIDGYSINFYSSTSNHDAAISFCTTEASWDETYSDANLALAGANSIVFGHRNTSNKKWEPMCEITNKSSAVTFQPCTNKTVLLGSSSNKWSQLFVKDIRLSNEFVVDSANGDTNNISLSGKKIQCKKNNDDSDRVELNSDDANGCSIYFKNGNYYAQLYLTSDGDLKLYNSKDSKYYILNQ